jgi:hypothetical protein
VTSASSGGDERVDLVVVLVAHAGEGPELGDERRRPGGHRRLEHLTLRARPHVTGQKYLAAVPRRARCLRAVELVGRRGFALDAHALAVKEVEDPRLLPARVGEHRSAGVARVQIAERRGEVRSANLRAPDFDDVEGVILLGENDRHGVVGVRLRGVGEVDADGVPAAVGQARVEVDALEERVPAGTRSAQVEGREVVDAERVLLLLDERDRTLRWPEGTALGIDRRKVDHLPRRRPVSARLLRERPDQVVGVPSGMHHDDGPSGVDTRERRGRRPASDVLPHHRRVGLDAVFMRVVDYEELNAVAREGSADARCDHPAVLGGPPFGDGLRVGPELDAGPERVVAREAALRMREVGRVADVADCLPGVPEEQLRRAVKDGLGLPVLGGDRNERPDLLVLGALEEIADRLEMNRRLPARCDVVNEVEERFSPPAALPSLQLRLRLQDHRRTHRGRVSGAGRHRAWRRRR